MTRPAHDTDAAAELGSNLSRLRQAKGNPGFEEIAGELKWIHGLPGVQNGERIRKAHRGGTDPNTADFRFLVALCNYYEVSPTELGPQAAAAMEHAFQMASKVLPFRDAAGPGRRPSKVTKTSNRSNGKGTSSTKWWSVLPVQASSMDDLADVA